MALRNFSTRSRRRRRFGLDRAPYPNTDDEPYYLSFRHLPEEARTIAAERIERYRDEGALPRAHAPLRQRLGVITALLRTAPMSDPARVLPIFHRFTEALDVRRGQRMAESLPELHEHLATAVK
jgi:hypothetical protein